MTLTLELTAPKEAALKAKAQAQGVSAEEYVQLMVDRDLEQPIATSGNEPAAVKPLQTPRSSGSGRGFVEQSGSTSRAAKP